MKLFMFFNIFSIAFSDSLHPLSDEFIEEINSVQSAWIAGKNFHEETPISSIFNKLGAWKGVPGSIQRNDSTIDETGKTIPDHFNALEHWPKCKDLIGHIPDQSSCKSDWAVASAAVMSDRLCIHSNGKVANQVSAANVLSCCTNCGFQCNGGWVIAAFKYWQEHGIVSGSDFNDKKGCQSYPYAPCEHYGTGEDACLDQGWNENTLVCTKTCSNAASLKYKNDLMFGSGSYWIYPNVTQLQLEIMTNGPIVAQFLVYSDFVHYKEGVYTRTSNNSYDQHAVKLIGWGTDEKKNDYWLAVNSWNSKWGDNGFFKILRGEDHCGIESEAIAGIPIVPQSNSNIFSLKIISNYHLSMIILISIVIASVSI